MPVGGCGASVTVTASGNRLVSDTDSVALCPGSISCPGEAVASIAGSTFTCWVSSATFVACPPFVEPLIDAVSVPVVPCAEAGTVTVQDSVTDWCASTLAGTADCALADQPGGSASFELT